MLHWQAGMSTGVPELDYHHRQIIDRFNDFSACMSLGESERLAEAGRILDFLQFYAQWHFKREEAYMEKYGCPAREENRRAHADFLKRFSAFYEEWQTRGMDPALVNDTFTTLMEWILNHIQGVDTVLNRYVPKPQKDSEA
jgi:hemerythrin